MNSNADFNDSETQSTCCLSCGIAREAVTIDSNGNCQGCSYFIMNTRVATILSKAYQTKFYNKSALYLLQFSTGTKIGKATNAERRIGQYQSPWMLPILKIHVIATPESILDLAEKVMLGTRHKDGRRLRRKGSEFFELKTITDLQYKVDDTIAAFIDEYEAYFKDQ